MFPWSPCFCCWCQRSLCEVHLHNLPPGFATPNDAAFFLDGIKQTFPFASPSHDGNFC
jgi:hypothetical protein